MAGAILVVDDDPPLLTLLTLRLAATGRPVVAVASAEEALAALDRGTPAVVVSDVRLPGMDGLALFRAIQARHPSMPVILLTAHGTIPDAVEATRQGAFAYLTKPFDGQALRDRVEEALALGGEPPAEGGGAPWPGLVWTSAAMGRVLEGAGRVAPTDASVLIRGPSGSGKEVLARGIHQRSRRRAGPFVAVNCGAIPENLLESELFGHRRGAFTGANREAPGLVRAAHGGTLFLDEIGDMQPGLQVKLLRVLQERVVRPLGATMPEPVDVRVISATHRDLEAAVAAGAFREDLFYRLNVVSLSLPALAERREDIPLLARHFLLELAGRHGLALGGFAPEALAALGAAPWPGNVRQLHNVVERLCVMAGGPLIALPQVAEALGEASLLGLEEARQRFERDYLVSLLKLTGGRVGEAARLARRNRTEFYRLLHRHALEPADFRGEGGLP
ncbi:MAG: sigma-54 dependent transcriptional regulator [Rhodocyclaceae bacterium]|jgi:two-component system response regulator GlrR|nr:sigma-54 dependent transcriptional regulator [Rhodocyclaceae bacterium]